MNTSLQKLFEPAADKAAELGHRLAAAIQSRTGTLTATCEYCLQRANYVIRTGELLGEAVVIRCLIPKEESLSVPAKKNGSSISNLLDNLIGILAVRDDVNWEALKLICSAARLYNTR